jgi:uncharacterized protein YndB with AHSA1/START domain
MDTPEIILTRHLKAAPEDVWSAWTDPAVLPQWFGPAGHSCKTSSIDLRQGGHWVFDMIGPDGTIYPNRHRYTLYDRPRRIEFDMDDGADNGTKKASVTLSPEADGTRITMRLVFPDAEYHAMAVKFGAVELGMTTLAKLAAVVERRAA